MFSKKVILYNKKQNYGDHNNRPFQYASFFINTNKTNDTSIIDCASLVISRYTAIRVQASTRGFAIGILLG